MSVTLTATLPATLPDVNVITTLESPQGDDAAVTPPLTETVAGVTPGAKNLEGYMRVIVLKADSAPPALGVKPNVTGTPALLTTRSLLAIPKATFETEAPMYPEKTTSETELSWLVDTYTEPPAIAVFPIMRPMITMSTGSSEGTLPDKMVITMLESLVGSEEAVAFPLNEILEGLIPEVKNPDGYVNVILLNAISAPPALGVKPNVTGTPGLLTTRSLFAMLNATLVTAPPIQPEAVLSEETSSWLVVTLTGPPAVGVSPIVSPLSVTNTATFGPIVPDCNVITMLESLLAAATAVACALSATLEAVTPEAKKPCGYINVTVFGAERAPAALGVKLKVTGTPARFTTRSLLATINEILVAAPAISPEGVETEGNMSWLVVILTGPPNVGADPIVRPIKVTLTWASDAT
jgi:hypothetical protein